MEGCTSRRPSSRCCPARDRAAACRVKATAIEQKADGYRALAFARLLLPPPLARLIADLSHQHRDTSGATWLFPHPRHPTRHRSASSLTAQLNTYGIRIKAGRAAALMNAALDASVDELSSKLGIHRATAARWKRRANRDRNTPVTTPPNRSRSTAVSYQPGPLSAPPTDVGAASTIENALRAAWTRAGQRAGCEITQGQKSPKPSAPAPGVPQPRRVDASRGTRDLQETQ